MESVEGTPVQHAGGLQLAFALSPGVNMQGEQTEEKSLQVIVGEQLSAVTFVQDYVQLHFDGPRLTVFSHAVVISGDKTFHWGKPGFRDALCNSIAKKV